MKGGNFKNLKAGSKVKFLEEIAGAKSISFKGVETIVRADSKDDTISFAELGEQMMELSGRKLGLIERCTTDGILDYEKLKQMVMQKRVEFVKSKEKSGLRTLSDSVAAALRRHLK